MRKTNSLKRNIHCRYMVYMKTSITLLCYQDWALVKWGSILSLWKNWVRGWFECKGITFRPTITKEGIRGLWWKLYAIRPLKYRVRNQNRGQWLDIFFTGLGEKRGHWKSKKSQRHSLDSHYPQTLHIISEGFMNSLTDPQLMD